jgi:broad specificity phosphatase PhoE
MPSTAIAGATDMPVLMLLRHGPTDWSAAHRLQGRSDVPLSDEGRAFVAGCRLPEGAMSAVWVTSPLQRCRETTDILRRHHDFTGVVRHEPRLVEMSFGDWEGFTLSELRARHGAAMAALEGLGLDFRAPGGESPRDVQTRLAPWLKEIAAEDGDVLAVTHKGVIRALYALASGWDMRTKAPDRLADGVIHAFAIDGGAELRIVRLNTPLRSDRPLAGTPA